MDKRYQHQSVEDTVYARWEKSGGFAPRPKKSAKDTSFTIIMPPPNANDPLHIGHAMFVTVEDILIRYHRMLGDSTLWLPGTDHAGIETQFVFEKKLKKKKQSRFNFDRETLYDMIAKYVDENSGTAVNQLKKLGASADWSRYKFTLDSDIIKTVIATFKKLHDKDLIYRDLRLVNYCVHCGTGFSELETKHVTRKAPLYYMKYGPFTLATVRPETKFGDTAIAVNPNDKRYQKYIGKEVLVKGLTGDFKIKVIADDYVDPEFGTGVVKVTPAHDHNDFAIWQRHKNEIPAAKQVIDFSGKLNHFAGKYEGTHVKKARTIIVADLQKAGLLEKVDEDYEHTIATCYRCGNTLEPLPLPQFFVKVAPLTKPVLKALKAKDVVIHGPGYDKILTHWLKNLKDWNVSRQIVWGIRMPVWYEIKIRSPKLARPVSQSEAGETQSGIIVTFIDKKKEKVVGNVYKLLENYSLEEIKKGLQELRAPITSNYTISSKSPGKNYLQETDTFDTWFSSGQWPIATLRTGQKNDFENFYPTQVMETAYDILVFWVMRMLLLGIFLTGKPPFKHVYLHGLVRDEKGQKMAKSRGNVINPLDITAKYGADALRMALVMSTAPGRDSSTGDDKIRGMRNFTNKIWNATRFVVTNLEFKVQSSKFKIEADKEFYKKLQKINKKITKQLDDLKVGLAAETVYNEFWHWFCDKCIEQGKKGEISQVALITGLATFLKLLHPFVPFVTEAAWEKLYVANDQTKDILEEKVLMNTSWPHAKK